MRSGSVAAAPGEILPRAVWLSAASANLAADDRLHPGSGAGGGEFERAEQIAGIGDGHGRHPLGLGTAAPLLDRDRPGRQRIGGMDAQMDEIGERHAGDHRMRRVANFTLPAASRQPPPDRALVQSAFSKSRRSMPGLAPAGRRPRPQSGRDHHIATSPINGNILIWCEEFRSMLVETPLGAGDRAGAIRSAQIGEPTRPPAARGEAQEWNRFSAEPLRNHSSCDALKVWLRRKRLARPVGVLDAALDRLARRHLLQPDQAQPIVGADAVVIGRVLKGQRQTAPAFSGSTRGCGQSCGR